MYPKTPKNNDNKTLLLILGLEIVLIVGLIISIMLTNTSKPSNQSISGSDFSSTSNNDKNNNNNKKIIDERPDCEVRETTDAPFSDIEMDYPYAGIYESTGKYLCSNELSYKVRIPQDITKVYYFIANGGAIGIVGLELNGEVLAAPITLSNFSYAAAGTITMATQAGIQEIQANEIYSNIYKIVFSEATPELLKTASDDETTSAFVEMLYGDESSFYILYNSQISPELYGELGLADSIPSEILSEMNQSYANRNQKLIDKVEETFANPDNYSKLEQ